MRVWIIATVAACIGLVDSFYLTLDHYIALPLPCTITHGCDTVLHSPYSMIGPIPLAAFGVLYYLTVGSIALYIATGTTVSRRLISLFYLSATAGLVLSIGFESLQYFVIHAMCQYCALSALSTLVLFVCAMYHFVYCHKRISPVA
jgi:uncharacterized membrane protein